MTGDGAATLVLLGPPGAGKGTQAGILRQRHGFEVVASGELLRAELAAGTPLGRAAREDMAAGRLVRPEIVDELVLTRVHRYPGRGLVVDGYPKTVPQARALDGALRAAGRAAPLAVEFAADRATLARRLHLRARSSGRPDDTPATVRARLAGFGTTPAELLAFYAARGALLTLDAALPVPDVAARLARAALGDPRNGTAARPFA